MIIYYSPSLALKWFHTVEFIIIYLNLDGNENVQA